MRTTVELDYEIIDAAARATVYSLLATGLALPTTDRLSLLGTKLLPGMEALELPDSLHAAMQAVSSRLPVDLEAARDDHMALFPPITSQDAPGYETAYRGDGIFQQAALLADIAGFYRAQGLRAGGTERERLDHITVELEFMAVLARKEVLSLQSGWTENTGICRDMAALFLQDHLGCWAPAFGRRASTVSGSPWYQSLGSLLALWVEEEIAGAGVTPVEVVGEPLPQEPPDDGACGPCPMPEQGSA
jgi:TorA maturation chaperone TorD